MINDTAWFYKYQPKTIDEYVFESEEQKNTINNWIETGRIPGNLLLYGPPGTGKTALSEILINSIIKDRNDLNKIKSRSVNAIDELTSWVVKQPVRSKCKIIYLEEFDKLSNQAMGQLKDGMMEKYQNHVSFIATTNYINKIDKAVLTRFNFKYNLLGQNTDAVYNRLSCILQNENVEFDSDRLKDYVTTYIAIGIRDLINNLQINCIDNKINFDNIKIEKSAQESDIVQCVIEIIEYLLRQNDINNKRIVILQPLRSEIAPQYSKIQEIINNNQDINYEFILEELNNQISFLPIKIIISKYINDIDYKRYPNMHFLACLTELIQCINELI
jgi:DNA polymerase III gamma/tau subunit